MLVRLHRALSAVESAAGFLSGLCMFAIMLIVFVDVVLRYAFNSPLSWSYDLVSLYLMVALFFLAVSITQRDGHHVNVDFIAQRVSPRARQVMSLLGDLPSAGLVYGIAWLGFLKFRDDWQSQAVTAGSIPWPSWLTAVFVPLGFGLLGLRLTLDVALRASALAGGDDTPLRRTIADVNTGGN